MENIPLISFLLRRVERIVLFFNNAETITPGDNDCHVCCFNLSSIRDSFFQPPPNAYIYCSSITQRPSHQVINIIIYVICCFNLSSIRDSFFQPPPNAYIYCSTMTQRPSHQVINIIISIIISIVIYVTISIVISIRNSLL